MGSSPISSITVWDLFWHQRLGEFWCLLMQFGAFCLTVVGVSAFWCFVLFAVRFFAVLRFGRLFCDFLWC